MSTPTTTTPTAPTTICGRSDEYLAGALDAREEAAFLAHAASCARCQAGLHDGVQLAGLEADARAARGGKVIAIGSRRFRRAALVIVPLLAAAAALAVWMRPRGAGPDAAGPVLALADTRALEPRLTWAPADRFRPYDVARSADPDGAGEAVTPQAILALSARGDLHGAAAAWILSGDHRRAATALADAGSSPDLDSDRTALALLEGDAERALGLADAVLRARPDHVQALWNRGLALRDLGAPLAAAEDFARVARLDPSWRAEAETRAAALEGEVGERRDAWFALRQRAFVMVDGGAPLDATDARRFPGTTRRFFYEAVRVAPDAARVAALRPLALELDRVYGGDTLLAWIDRAARADFARRAPALADYARLVKGELAASDPAVTALVVRARRGGDDLLAGALALSGQAPAHAADLRRFAAQSGDAWFELVASEAEAQAALYAGDPQGAERRWLDARARCQGSRLALSCAKIEVGLANLYLATYRFVDARTAARAAAALAAQGGEWGVIIEVLSARVRIEQLHERWPLARAFMREAALAAPDYCPTRHWVGWLAASVAILERRPEEAVAEAKRAPTCEPPTWSLDELSVLVDLERFGLPVMERGAVRALITAQRAGAPAGTPTAAFLDYAEGRLLLDADGAEGDRLLAAAIAAGRALGDDELARATVRAAATTRAVDAGRRGAWDGFFTHLGDLGAPPRARCVLGAAIDDERAAVAARGADGRVVGHYQAKRREIDPASLVPATLVAALAGCDTVAVHASPLLVGQPLLLPATLPWGYRVSAQAATTTAPGRRLVVLDATPPAEVGLPALGAATAPATAAATVVVRGAEAHPARVLLEMQDATEIEIHAHGMIDLGRSSAPLLALSPGPDGAWAFTVEALAGKRLVGAPVIALADCGAAALSGFEAWGLPTALLDAGARAVLGSPSVIGDAHAAAFFTDVLDRVRAGEAPAAALAAARQKWQERAPWVREVMVFE